jgi:hypothetical protein
VGVPIGNLQSTGRVRSLNKTMAAH